ncbi:MAG: hypothetical protein WCC92_06210 [Candidatus Korobacteraceae bacterium]
MRDQIQAAAVVLVGKPLWLCRRAGDMAMFHFGERRKETNRRGELSEIGEYALHLHCPWRIVNGEEILMAALDVYKPQSGHEEEDDRDFVWERAGNLLDERARAFFDNDAREYIVECVQAGHAGALRLSLEGELWLEICPCDSTKGEHWRLFQPCTEREHFAVTGAGIGEVAR